MAVETAPRPNGLKTAWDTIVAPKEAFTSLRIAPTWGWALLIVVVVGMLASYLVTPAIIHGLTADWPNMVAKNPALSGLTADQQQAQLSVVEKVAALGWIFSPLIYAVWALLGAVVLLVFNALGHGDGTFAKYWAAQWNIALVTVLGSVAVAVIVFVRAVDSFNSSVAVQTAVPSLAMLVPATSVKLHTFLAFFTPFSLWATGLEIAALATIGNVPRIPAWLGGILTLLLPAIVLGALAR
ncbi:MAG TPA: hypothetical protein VIK27_02415 [Candidatus Aquilonibacter sp.]